MLKRIPAYAILCVGFFALSACGGGSDNGGSSTSSSSSSSSGGATSYTVGGTITGLTGTGLVLKDASNNHQVTVAANATTFTLTPAIASGTAYSVSVLTQPTGPSQTCTVTSGATGTVTTAAVTSVAVTCTTSTYTVGGTITGLTGTGLVLKDTTNNHPVTVAANATTFTITPAIVSGTAYSVSVLTQPAGQTCTVTSGATGTVTANVTSVAVSCTTNSYTVGGTISGLTGSGLVLKDTTNNHPVTVAANATTFTITPAIASGTAYAVSVLTQPTAPAQTCTVTGGGTGTVTTAAVTSVAITCVTTTYTVGGTISGLTSTSGVVLKDTVNNHQVTVPANATTFTIPGGVAPGGTYAVSVLTQPTTPAQFCRVTAGTGNITTANVMSVTVKCTNVGQVVFAANTFDNGPGSLSSFTINPATGALTATDGTPATPAIVPATDQGPMGLAVDPSGGFLYVANQGFCTPTPCAVAGNDVAVWPINTNGTLGTEGIAQTISATNEPVGLAVTPATTGSFLFVGSNDTVGDVSAFHPVAGVLGARLGGSPYASGDVPFNLVVDSTKAFVFAANLDVPAVTGYSIGALGILTPLAPETTALIAPYGVAASPTGLFIYVTDLNQAPPTLPAAAGSVNLYSYNGTTGVLTFVHTYAVGIGPYGIAIDPSGQFLYVSNGVDGTVSGFTIDPTAGTLISTGAAVLTGASSVTVAAPATALVVDPSSQYLYVANGDGPTTGSSPPAGSTISVMAIDQATGQPALVGAPVPASNTGGGTTAIAIK
jgi:6-phosphogluconolactonase (cycloisomerase 2 family)